MIGQGLLPEWVTAKQVADSQGWPEARAVHVLDGLVERGAAEKNADDKYRITGVGLAVGERLGVVKPVNEWGKS